MQDNVLTDCLRVGVVGSGFVARFHLNAFEFVRNVRIAGVYSPNPAHREDYAQLANQKGLGPCKAYESLESMVQSDEIDAIWLLSPNFARLDHMRTIHRLVKDGKASLMGVACEKPLARTLAEGREMLAMVQDANLNHGYLENQLFSTPVQRGRDIIWRRAVPNTGRPYLARAAEEHSGPHMPWFWRPDLQGGGVLLDMMCHSVEVARFLLTEPGKPRNSLKLMSATGTVANLKWTRPEYIQKLIHNMGPEVDYSKRPAEDFARGILHFQDESGNDLIVEATTSWAYVGPGLRLTLELLGPEYSMEINSLNTSLKVFLSREVRGEAGEDLVEKQNAEQGLMPVVEDEAAVYGYTLEDRHMVESFRRGIRPLETFEDGVAVLEMLMGLYLSAETKSTVEFPDARLENFVPSVARVG